MDRRLIGKIGGGFSSDKSTAPLLKPKNFQWVDGISEVNLYIDRAITEPVDDSKINFGWLLESPSVLNEIGIYDYIIFNIEELKSKFKKIFTSDKRLVDPFFKYAYSDIVPWINEDNYKIYEKTKFCSIIASSQRKHPGHILRHEIIEKYSNIDHFGFGYPSQLSIEDSYLGFRDYMFSFCIENCSCAGYWGLKLTNAIACGTVPIYWGDPEIDSVFDTRGFIMIDDSFDYNRVTSEDYYDRMEYVEKNFEILKTLILPEDTIYKDYLSYFI